MDSNDDPATKETHTAAAAQRLWTRKAEEWDQWIGLEGDRTRRLISDRVLWQLLGDVAGRDVLDAGCGNGYLAVQMARRGARVVAVDWSEAMVARAQARATEAETEAKADTMRAAAPEIGAPAAALSIQVRRDDCRHLATVADASMDRLVSNYVLMDTPDLDTAVTSFWRVLRPGGTATIIILHPCFEVPGGPAREPDGSITFRWPHSYFDELSFEETWGPFQTPFVAYHRPLSRYWASFRAAGFTILDIQEPAMQPGSAPPEQVQQARMWPASIAFLLGKSA